MFYQIIRIGVTVHYKFKAALYLQRRIQPTGLKGWETDLTVNDQTVNDPSRLIR